MLNKIVSLKIKAMAKKIKADFIKIDSWTEHK